jgi:eukaryotic-like serine/threonine-protein kinase
MVASPPLPAPASSACRACGARLQEPTAHFCSTCGALQVSPTGDVNIGTVVSDRYRLVRLLGEGASGRVYEARQAVGRSERRVAVKVLHLKNADNPKLVKRVEREIEIACSLEHPSTIRVFDFGETSDGRPFVVMEFIDGAPLATVLHEEGALPLERTVGIFSQVCGALQEAHDRGIVHRDLKPENIMLMQVGGQQDLVKVLDFGIAKQIAPGAGPETIITDHGMVVGTPEYMSPEQFSGGSLDPGTDIYALGVMAYEMLTGRLPFHAEDLLEWAKSHAIDPPPPFDQAGAGGRVPDAAEAAVMHALAKRPEARPPSAAAFYAELAAALPGDTPPPLGRASSPPPPTRKVERRPAPPPPEPEPRRPTTTLPMDFGASVRRRKRLLIAGVALLVLGAVAAAVLLLFGVPGSQRAPPPLPPAVVDEPGPLKLLP